MVGTNIIPFIQIKKLRHRGSNPEFNSGLLDSKASVLQYHYLLQCLCLCLFSPWCWGLEQLYFVVFIAALFTIARSWKQPKCPSSDEWIKKMWHIYTMEYYSAIKRNEIELFVVRWMDLESVIQSEVTQKEKNKYRMLTHIYGI